jgi:hypothetical protein
MNAHTKHPLHERTEKMLADFGGFYTFEDILDGISVGRFQSFAYGDSWAVTQVCDFPRRTVLEIMFVVGHEKDLDVLHADIIGWAREQGIGYMMANARLGFDRIKKPGWKMVSALFVKDLSDGS